MADILPFIGTRYNSQLIGNLGKVVSPPFDGIAAGQQDALHERHPNNFVRIIHARDGGEEDAYTSRYLRAANTLKTWRSDGIFIEDDKPSFYLYEQEFAQPGGERFKRRGLFALVRIGDADNGLVPHMAAHSDTLEERLKLIRATQANLSATFAAYEDPTGEALAPAAERMKDKPWEEVTDDEKTIHRLWVLQKRDSIMEIRDHLAKRSLYLLDGHHRYQAALAYRDEMRDMTGRKDGKQPFDYMMMFLAPVSQETLFCRTNHRAFTRHFTAQTDLVSAFEELSDSYDCSAEKYDSAKPEVEAKRLLAKAESHKVPAFVFVMPNGKAQIVRLKKGIKPADVLDDDVACTAQCLDVTLLHHHIINQVFIGNPEFEIAFDDCTYCPDPAEVLRLIAARQASLGVLLRDPPLPQVYEAIRSGALLPSKAFQYGPKVITGLVLRNLGIDAKKGRK